MDTSTIQRQPLSVFQQIEEMKTWRKRLPTQTNIENSKIEHDSIYKEKFEQGGYKSSNITQPEKKLTTQYEISNFDDVPVKVATTNFKELVENNVSPNDNLDQNLQVGKKAKFPFLRKGEGIARFRMGPPKATKYKSRSNRTLNLSNDNIKANVQVNYQNDKHNLNEQNVINREEIPTLNPPDVKLDLKNFKSLFYNSSGDVEEVIERVMFNNQLELFQPDSSIDSSTASFMEKMIPICRKFLKEKEELRVFETMEEHIQDSSFCSTSSYVTKLMQNAVISTPIKKTTTNNCVVDSNAKLDQLPAVVSKVDGIEKLTKKVAEHVKPDPPAWICANDQETLDDKLKNSSENKDLEHSLHVRFAEEVDYKSFAEYSQSVNDSNHKNVNNSGEFNESEEWKEDDGEDSTCCSQCSTEYSSSDDDVRPISPPQRVPPAVKTNFANKCTLEKNTASRDRSPVEKLEMADLQTNSLLDKENKQSAMNNEDTVPPVLKKKLVELEHEIETFRVDNKKLKSLCESLERERKQLQIEKKKFLKEVEEEKKRNATQLEEEKQKLAKAKLVYEKHSKSLAKNPSKEERKEIQALREQLSEMKEELNKKESRWGAAQARVRNQVKHLEEDNKKLREEVDVLRKQAKYLELLTQNRKGKPPNNTKLIHAISEYISTIPIEDGDLIKSASNQSYFSSKENPVKGIGHVVNDVDPSEMNTVRVVKEIRQENKSKKTSMDSNVRSAEQMYNKMVECMKNPTETKSQTQTVSDVDFNSKSNDTNHEVMVKDGKEMPQKSFPENQSTSYRETVTEEGAIERNYPDGRKEIRYKNGNVKKVDPFSGSEKIIYFNGDVKEVMRDRTVKYYFSESRTWHTTLPDGLELLDFPNGQVEKRHTNGLVEIIYPNNSKKLTYPDGCVEIYYTDGTRLRTEADKTKILFLPNGQKEIHTDECVRREYPDGTVKTVYSDGVTETVYSNGRVRLKDKHGKLVMDSATSANKLLC